MTASTTIASGAEAGDRIEPKRLLTFIAMCFGMFMAFLDIQIVASSLGDIQAGLSASAREISWVQTSYLIAEVISIPLSGFLSRALGTRLLFSIAAAGFTLSSIMCAVADSIGSMIFWRALQGFVGGGMIPTVFASVYLIFTPRQQRVVVPIVGLVATLAPTVGPVIGGYITDAMTWPWLFYINVIPGIVVAVVTALFIDFDEPDFKLLRYLDWLGLLFMAGFLGTGEYVLEEGPTYDWFDDRKITWLAVITTTCAILFFIRALTARVPIVDLRAFKNRNFSIGAAFSFVIGIGLYGLVYLYPIYLARVRGYSPMMIGETMFISGFAMLLGAPIVGFLTNRCDPRWLLMFGFLCFATGTWQMTFVTGDWDFWELFWPQVFRGFGLIFSIVTVTNTALSTLPLDRVKNASGLFNLMRNLGGAVGLALINTLLKDRMDLHLQRLRDSIDSSRFTATEMMQMLAERFGGSDAQLKAIKYLVEMVRAQAQVMSFADVFLVITWLFAGMAVLAIVMQKPKTGQETGQVFDEH